MWKQIITNNVHFLQSSETSCEVTAADSWSCWGSCVRQEPEPDKQQQVGERGGGGHQGEGFQAQELPSAGFPV